MSMWRKVKVLEEPTEGFTRCWSEKPSAGVKKNNNVNVEKRPGVGVKNNVNEETFKNNRWRKVKVWDEPTLT